MPTVARRLTAFASRHVRSTLPPAAFTRTALAPATLARITLALATVALTTLAPTGCAPAGDADEGVAIAGDAGSAARSAGTGVPVRESVDGRPYIVAAGDVQAGRYLAVVGGCNDCHTEGYLQSAGDVPEERWLSGSRIGWRGPWGTTYAANLRLRVEAMTEDDWVRQMHERHANPPMPWMNVNRMSDRDARSLYRYIDSLGPFGEPVPSAVPPGEEPSTPFISLAPQNMEAAPGG